MGNSSYPRICLSSVDILRVFIKDCKSNKSWDDYQDQYESLYHWENTESSVNLLGSGVCISTVPDSIRSIVPLVIDLHIVVIIELIQV